MRQRGHDAQGLGAGVENGRQARAAFVVLLLAQRPGLVLDDVLVDRRHQAPGHFQRPRELVLIEQRVELRDRLARRFRDGVVLRRCASRRAKDTAPRR